MTTPVTRSLIRIFELIQREATDWASPSHKDPWKGQSPLRGQTQALLATSCPQRPQRRAPGSTWGLSVSQPAARKETGPESGSRVLPEPGRAGKGSPNPGRGPQCCRLRVPRLFIGNNKGCWFCLLCVAYKPCLPSVLKYLHNVRPPVMVHLQTLKMHLLYKYLTFDPWNRSFN